MKTENMTVMSKNIVSKMRLTLSGVAVAAALALTSAPAHANYEAGVEAYMSGQYSQALDIWGRFAVAGDVRSKRILGDIYSGKEVEGAKAAANPLEEIPVDNVDALMWYTLAAYHDFTAYQTPTAQEVNARILAEQRLPEIRGRMSTGDVKKAEKLVAQTFESGSPYDIYRLGDMYQKGAGVQKNNAKALQMYTLAKARGVGEASAAFEFLEPLMNAGEVKTALAAAEKWQPPLPVEHTGKTSQQVEIETLKRELEELKLSEALKAVSDIDIELLQRALNALGFRAGKVDNKLGPSTREAIRRFQYSQASRNGSLSPEEKASARTGVLSPKQKVDLIADAAKSGHPYSEYIFGLLHVSGVGVLQDNKKGVSWLARAADQEMALAHYVLGDLYRSGTVGLNGFEPDETKSAFHFARAYALGYKPANDALHRLSFENVRDNN